MPYEWTEPELLMVHRGVPVYHTYSGGPGNENVSECHYAMCGHNTDEDADDQFDVRDLPQTPEGWLEYYSDLYPDEGHKQRIAHAIDAGHFKDWQKDEPPPYWYLTEDQKAEIREAALQVLINEVEDVHNLDPEFVFCRYAEMRMLQMGISDLVDMAKDDESLAFDPDQQQPETER